MPMHSPRSSALVILAVTWSSALAVDSPLLSRPTFNSSEHMTGDWGGPRQNMWDEGVLIDASLTVQPSWYGRQGADGAQRYMFGVFDAGLTLDTERAWKIEGGTFHVEYLYAKGDDGSAQSGLLQPPSWLDSPERHQIARLWYRQVFFGGFLSFKAGKEDARVDFDTRALGNDFRNASVRSSPTIIGFPTHPDPATSLSGGIYTGILYARAGVFDGRGVHGLETGREWLGYDRNELFMISEGGLLLESAGHEHLGAIGIGTWRHTADFQRYDGTTATDTSGLYANADVMLVQSPFAKNRGLGLFALAGTADKQITAINRHAAGGFSWDGWAATRPDDAFGVAASWAGTSRQPGSTANTDEYVIEGYYRFAVTHWLFVTPDLQWFSHPSGISSADPLWVGLLTIKAVL